MFDSCPGIDDKTNPQSLRMYVDINQKKIVIELKVALFNILNVHS